MRRNSGRGSAAKKTALAGMLAALSVVILFLGNVSGVMDLVALCMASALTAVAVIELGGAYPYLLWAVVSVISVIILPDKLLAATYALFGGIYPVLKMYFERLSRAVCLIVKLSYGAVVLGVLYVLDRFFLGGTFGTGWLLWGLLAGYAVFYLLYDRALTVAIVLYVRKIRNKLPFVKGIK